MAVQLLIGLAMLASPRTQVEVQPTVSVPMAKQLTVQGGARLIDVRSPEEYAAKHIENAINIPVQELAYRLEEVGSKSTPVIVYCTSGERAAFAAKILKAAGWTDVYNLGGMNRWNEKPKAAGRELVRAMDR
jgi:rhodanese-related sulfurtransferase